MTPIVHHSAASRHARRALVRFACAASLLLPIIAMAATPATPDWDKLDRQVESDPTRIRDLAQRYLAQYKASGDKKQTLEALSLLVDAEMTLNEYTKADALLEQGLPLAHDLNDADLLLSLLWSRGGLRQQRGDLVGAMYDYDAADAIAQQTRKEAEHAGLLVEKARVLETESRYNDALPLLFEAHSIFERRQQKAEISKTLGALADTYSGLGDESQAVNYYRRAMAGLNADKDRYTLSTLSYNLATSLFRLGKLDEAEHLLTQNLAYALKLNDRASVGFIRYRLGTIAEQRGWEKTALEYYDGALPEFVRTDDPAQQFFIQVHRAQLLAKSNPAAAQAAFSNAMLLLNRIDTPERRMDLHESGANMYKRMGRFHEALTELEAWVASEKASNAQFNRKAATEMQVRFDAKQKEIENALLKSEQQRQAAEIKASRTGRWLLVIGLSCSVLLLGTLGFLLVQQVRQKRRYADLALLDELTGAPNRRHILAYAKSQLDACRTAGSDLSIAVIDLDYFKTVNDRCGHETGDDVLKAFAQSCQGELRRGDRLGRLGGEEWLLVMPSAKQDEMAAVFERLRATYQQHAPETLPDDIKLSFSMGVAQAQAGESFERLLARADTAMYAAKEAGRDRFTLAQKPPVPQSAFEPDG
jgi:diguanylate cyclase (GGDEF)-like protein